MRNAIVIALLGATVSLSVVAQGTGGAQPWFTADSGGAGCRTVQPPAERVQALRAAGDRGARATAYSPDGAPTDSEPTRFLVQRSDGSSEIFFRLREDCLARNGRAAQVEIRGAPGAQPYWYVIDGQRLCRAVEPPNEWVARLRGSGDRSARAVPYRPDGVSPAAEPTRFTVERARGEPVVFYRRLGDCTVTRDRQEAASRPPPPASEWWGIGNISAMCEAQDQGPAEFLRNAQTLGIRYRAQDVTDPESGRVVETTIQVLDMGSQITFYRGRERCQAALDRRSATRTRELDRYR